MTTQEKLDELNSKLGTEIQKIKKRRRIVIVAMCIWLSLCIFYTLNNLKKTTIVLVDEDERIIDSLQQEILLRDNLINQCKDTIYGEEISATNNNR